MDQQKLRNLVFEKTGVRIDVDDPIFALVALNEAVLAEAVERHVALLDDATRTLADQLALPPGAAGARRAQQERRSIGIAAGAAVLGALLVLAGQALLFQPAPLTAQQAQAISDGARLAKAVQKLDPKARSQVQAEMDKP